MANRYTAFGWSIDLVPSWTAKIRQEAACGETSAFVAIAPKTNDALLRLTPDERGIVSAAEWVEVVGQFNRAKGRRVSATRCRTSQDTLWSSARPVSGFVDGLFVPIPSLST